MATSADKDLPKSPFRKPRLRTILFLGLIMAFTVTLSLLGKRMVHEISALQSAPNDNIQWNLAQLEIEYLHLLNSLKAARAAPGLEGSDLPEVRKRFDILFSRVETFRKGQAFRVIEGDSASRMLLAAIRSNLSDVLAVIDGGDVVFFRSLADLETHFLLIRSDIRSLSLQAVPIFAASSDRQREDFTLLLRQTAIAGVLLILALVAAVTVLVRQFRVAENRAREASTSNSRFQSTVNASLDAIILAGADGRIIDFNPSAEVIFGYTRSRAVGSKMEDLIIPPHLREAHLAGMRRFLDTGVNKVIDAGRVELDAMRAGGETFPIELSIGMTKEADGPKFIAYVRDISERKKHQRELLAAHDDALAADKAKSRFLAMMSHEMRTPLNGVLATLDLLQSSQLNSRQKEYVKTAIASGEILQQHLDDVLEITSIEAGILEFRNTFFSLSGLLEEVKRLNSGAAAEQDNEILIETSPDLPGTCSDRHRLRQILLNLVGNAVKFTQNGTITVSAKIKPSSYHGSIIELRVTDTGMGIKPEDAERIFDDFVTLDSSYRRKTQGYGLGLAICRRITEAMGGQIKVKSTPGSGSTFTVVIPVNSVPPPGPGRKADVDAPEIARRMLRVLLVEDNETNQFVARELLESEGCGVEIAFNGKEGVEKSEREGFDLILMDISMPLMDGIEATRLIREGSGKSAATPIVGLTAHALPHELENLAQAGMQDCIVKPLRKQKLQKLLGSFDRIMPHGSNGDPQGSQVIDRQVLLELAELLPPDRLKVRIEEFLGEISETETALKSHIEANRLEDLAHLAHRCAGSAATFGARQLATTMRSLELAAGNDKLDDELAGGLDDVFARTRNALLDYRVSRDGARDPANGERPI